MSTPSHAHAEAYALMRYDAMDAEPLIAWNSRDGVTPFVIRHNGIERVHRLFDHDVFAPEHIPDIGQLVFVDLTYQIAQALADEYMKGNWEAMRAEPRFADLGYDGTRREVVTRYINDADRGAPYYLEATEALRHAVASLRSGSRVNTESEAARWWWQPGEPYYTCSYCGSVHPMALHEILKTPGAHFSGSDWKYGYPHKFYLDMPADALWQGSPSQHMKFYTRHLSDLPDEELKPLAELIEPFFAIRFFRDDDGRLSYRAVPNTQRWGVVP